METDRVLLDGGRAWLEAGARQLVVAGEPAKLGGRAFDLLLKLVEHRGRVVTKDELLDWVWPGLVVEENNLHVQVNALRKALGRTAISTVPGRGYSFALSVAAPASAAPAPVGQGSAGSARVPEAEAPAAAVAPVQLHGRDEDLAALRARLAPGRCISLVGPAGVGKTALARELARRALPLAKTTWVDLTSLREGALVVGFVAAACGVAVAGASPLRRLARGLAGSGRSLVLDNAEHLLQEVAALVRTLLDEAPDLVIVVTSQAPLHVKGEWVLRLGTLATPPAGVPGAAQALHFAAVGCFVEQVRQQDRRFVFDDAAAARVVRLCRQLDGLPLALRLAAARVPVLGLAAVEQHMEQQRLRLLSGGNRDEEARHGSLRLAIDGSVSLLAPAEQAVFDALGVLRGRFPLELGAATGAAHPELAASEVASDGDPEWAAVEAMATLVDRSLLEFVDGPRPHYVLLDSVRACARERLARSGHLASVSRHAATLLTGRFAALGENDPVGLARLLADANDAAGALVQWRRAIERAATANQLVDLEHHLNEALALMRSEALRDRPGLRAERLAMLLQLGSVNGLTHGLAAGECEIAFQEALPLADAEGSAEGRFIALFNLVFTYAMRLDHEAARQRLEEMHRLAAESPDERFKLQADHAEYSGAFFRGDLARTIATAEAGYRRYRPVDSAYHCRHFVGHDPGLCSAGHAGLALFFAGRIPEGEAYLARLRELKRQIVHPPSQIIATSIECWWLGLADRPDECWDLANQGLQLCRRLEVPVWEHYFSIIECWARLMRTTSPDPAIPDGMLASLDTVRRLGTRFRMPTYRVFVAEAYAAVGRATEGLQQVQVSLEEMASQREFISHAAALVVRARLHEALGKEGVAVADWRAAAEVARGQGMGLVVLRAATGLAAAEARAGSIVAARQCLAEALRPFDPAWRATDLRAAREMMVRLGGVPAG